LAEYVAVDGSGSGRDPRMTKHRLVAINQVVEKTVVCGGELSVVGFSNSSGSNVTLYQGDFLLPGATEVAQLRVAEPVIAKAMKAIRRAYGPAMASLPAEGSDIVAEYRLADEFEEALGKRYQLNLLIESDGLQNVNFSLEGPALDPAAAAALAKTVVMPHLPGASITVDGLGDIAGVVPAPSSQVAGLVYFYTDLCHETDAARCLSVTTLPSGW
jgi:hypothetical protein